MPHPCRCDLLAPRAASSLRAPSIARRALTAASLAVGLLFGSPAVALAADAADSAALDEEDALPNPDARSEEIEDEKLRPATSGAAVAGGNDAAPGPGAVDPQEGEDELTLDAWERDDWALARPRVALFDVAGYFRLRGDLYRRMDLGNNSAWEYDQTVPVPRYPRGPGSSARYSQMAMRLRIEPRLHVNDQLEVYSTVDVMDNLVFGSTPNTLPQRPGAERPPNNVLAITQMPMRRGFNALSDSIVVKRLWARVAFLNDQLELKVGRMPDHWGLGMWYNNGDCLNCDLGTMVDRISLTFRALGHTLQPQVDWVSRGPVRPVFGVHDLAPIDAANWDNAIGYGLRIAKLEHPDDIRDALSHGQHVVTYGLSNIVRVQAKDYPLSYYNAPSYSHAAGLPATDVVPERRDAVIYQGDLYGKYFASKLELGGEVALMAGTFRDSGASTASQAATNDKNQVLQLGLAAEATYHLREDRRGARLSLKLGGASGDNHQGMGAREMADTQRGMVADRYDRTLKNFQFSPDYHIDLLLFRRMIGTVTDAWYLRPEAAYRFDDKLSGRLALIYSQAIDHGSVPNSDANRARQLPLGVEVDGEVAYGLLNLEQRGQLMASLAAGMLFPLAGFDKRPSEGVVQRGSFAWTMQARMFLTF